MSDLQNVATCPICGAGLSQEQGSEGFCLACLMELALESPSVMAEIDNPEEAPTLAPSDFDDSEEAPTLGFAGEETFSEGRVHGDRYRIRSLLGKGGMGEVWRAYDLKLRLDVALKSLRDELIADEQALETLRQEVRTAREVISPNVCRVFDLQELDNQELISMEYVDGTTLQDVLKNRGPLELNEAREIASQFLAGLESIHDAGLVHRDIKPENLMITRTGRVVVMDFGIAKALQEGKGGLIAGTPAYMSPEQTRGQDLDARADLFSAGVVLAEMVEPTGLRSFEDRKRVWEGVHQESPSLAQTPWAKVISKAVEPNREARFASAAALARALEEVTLRAAGDEDAHPYPGLAAFQKEDARFFFGRELEVEALWKKLRRPQMLAVIGPSGAGKSSFLRAGLLSSLPESWGVILAQPGNRPFAALARALAGVLPSDQETVDSLLRFEDPATALALISDWRQQHEHTLIVIDQFEELFTQNLEPVQHDFAELVGNLPLEADVHVLLSMRDDFLFHCQAFEPLAPIFSELSPIGAPTGAALRRAIVQPALKCGYRFEDESLVEEMLSEVEGERGSLPMVAFAASKLWQLRDRDEGILTRKTYEQIGGVGGALAQHAEATLERIGTDQIPIVRELFRNLVTAEGTRATRDRDELLSVFSGATPGDRPSSAPALESASHGDAESVLSALIDARLLTSYEVAGTEEEGRRTRIEIIHESLLSNWPRLARWRIQDADSAQLRDQLRQAAQVWLDRGRPTDLLWSGTSYQEFGLWRQRYSGGLSHAEEDFAKAMTLRAERRKRRRRVAIAAVIAVLAIGLGIVGVFWRQAAAARDQAETETLRAEANQLLSLGRLEMENDTTGALAYALASLERTDQPGARMLALEALSFGPTALVLDGFPGDEQWGTSLDFSPDGKWLVHGGGIALKVWPSSGEEPRILDSGEAIFTNVRFSSDSELVVDEDYRKDVVRVWSISDGQLVRTLPTEGELDFRLLGNPERIFTFNQQGSATRVEAWSLSGGEPERYGDLPSTVHAWSNAPFAWNLNLDSTGTRLVYATYGEEEKECDIGEICLVELTETENSAPKLVGRHDDGISRATFHPDGRHLATADQSGEVRIWDLESGSESPQRILRQPPAAWVRTLRFDSTGGQLATATWNSFAAIWNLEGPPDAGPALLRRGETDWMIDATFHPEGDWVATASHLGAAVWPIARRYPVELSSDVGAGHRVLFLPDGERLLSGSSNGTVTLWPLSASAGTRSQVISEGKGDWLHEIAVDPSGAHVLVPTSSSFRLIPLDGRPPRDLKGVPSRGTGSLVVGARQAAAVAKTAVFRVLRIWDLEAGEYQDFEKGTEIKKLIFTPDDQLISVGPAGIRVWNTANGSFETLAEPEIDFSRAGGVEISRDGRLLLANNYGENGEAVLFDVEAGTSLQLDSHGPSRCGALDPGGRFVMTVPCEGTGYIQIGPVSGGPTHLLLNQEPITWIDVSPDGQWIAWPKGDDSHSIRLWPVPDLSQPPFLTLPHDELLAKLRALTNLRAVPDPESDTGWGWALDPFPGWDEVPTW